MIQQDDPIFDEYPLEYTEKKYTEHLVCSLSTKKLIQHCKEQLKKEYSDLEGIPVSNDYIVRRVMLYWLGKRW